MISYYNYKNEPKKVILVILPLLLLSILSSCGHSEYYENGYKTGISHAESDVRNIKRITDSSKHKYISNDDFDADEAYLMYKNSVVWGLDESHESDYRSGFIDGYETGVENELGGKSSNSGESKSGGFKFWYWIVIIVVILCIFGSREDNKDSSSPKSQSAPDTPEKQPEDSQSDSPNPTNE